MGANSKDGFYSLYDGFCRGKVDYLTVIKGGPGTGKSGFMRKIAQCAEARGLDTEEIPCSGDPHSLDGIYIPALKRGWVDGTAPHSTDPARFGVNGDYVNLGEFFTGIRDEKERAETDALYSAYKQEYSAAYSYLASAAALRRGYIPPVFTGEVREQIERRIRNILRRCHVRGDNDAAGKPRRRERFLHAISCEGEIWLSGEIEKQCSVIYAFDNGLDGADTALKIACDAAEECGAEAILCRSPLAPARLDALILPEAGIGFASSEYALPSARHIRLDAAIDPAALQGHRSELREGRQTEARLKQLAIEHLKKAKALHDELEEHCKAHMDFAALTKYTQEYTARIFS